MVRTGYIVAGAAVIVILVGAVLLLNRPALHDEPTVLDKFPDTIYAHVSANSVADLQGVQFDVTFNPAVVEYTGIRDGTFLDEYPANPIVSDALKKEPGALRNIILLRTKQPGVFGTGLVAIAEFVRIGPGDPNIQLKNVLVSDSKGQPLDSDSITLFVSDTLS